MSQKFNLKSSFKPTGDQPKAINQLVDGVKNQRQSQVLLGVTGSGKTYTIANVIQKTQLSTLIISHNKTLAAQLYQEFRDFFPQNAVSYFVSYYDYYQPEAYIPQTDTYIEKETDINDEIDKLRLSTTTNLLTRPDVIVVASVSCIYNLGSPVEYGRYILEITSGQLINRESIIQRLLDLQYDRSNTDLFRGTFRLRGETLHVWPAYVDYSLRIVFMGSKIESITPVDPVSNQPLSKKHLEKFQLVSFHDSKPKTRFIIYPAKHYITDPVSQKDSIKQIILDLKQRLDYYNRKNMVVEAHRLKQKVSNDLEMINEFGFVNGIENYSRYFDGRKPGQPPYTLLDYMKHNAEKFHTSPHNPDPSFLTIIDESHITTPQIRGMYFGDRSRKQTLIDFGFRIPSALDNRPLKFDEFLSRIDKTIFVSATPSDWEVNYSNKSLTESSHPSTLTPQPSAVVEQLIRPTGLLDPEIEIRPTTDQIPNLVIEIINRVKKSQRVLVTTLTKRMAEDLTEFLNDEQKITELFEDTVKMVTLPKVAYLHSDIDTLDRQDILDDLRKGEYDVLVGINLLREGLDLPEVSLVAILDADKEGFLRSDTSLIQVMGRAARHVDGRVIMYADKTTGSMQRAIDEVNRRREYQSRYNQKHGITPQGISKPIRERLIERDKEKQKQKTNTTVYINKNESLDLADIDQSALTPKDKQKLTKKLNRAMRNAARDLDFELAAKIRDKITLLQSS